MSDINLLLFQMMKAEMKIFKKFKHFKIVEQIAFVILLAVFIPLTISGLVVNNINQHAVRNELKYSAKMIAEVAAENIQLFYQDESDIKEIGDNILSVFKNDKRQIYLLDGKNRDLLLSTENRTDSEYKKAVSELPIFLSAESSEIYGSNKNQPMAYYKLKEPNVIVVVNTTSRISNSTITEARVKIILSLLASAISIIFIIGFYTYYLYINIRQLFKGIMAISGGNYKRKIRLLTSIFTPYEIIFLSNEFNRMVTEINLTYRQLKSKNKELAYYNEFRSNLIDTVSHEFRTPLTSILGYTSRLLRKDIEINDETKEKSLKVIKNQAERLSRMVEDLLVIPDIENSKLNISLEAIDVEEIKENLLALQNINKREYIINIKDGIHKLYADKDRLEQVLINIFENANKYAYEDTPITVDIFRRLNKAVITVSNQADYIPQEKLKTLFEKFTRIDDKTTRTTRGTGLGLFIVKGLIDAMGGEINITSSPDNIYTVEIILDMA